MGIGLALACFAAAAVGASGRRAPVDAHAAAVLVSQALTTGSGCNASTLVASGEALLSARFSYETGTTSDTGAAPVYARSLDSLLVSMANAVRHVACSVHSCPFEVSRWLRTCFAVL